jgi:alkylation response protein AidB-like acyl-CoA dehydrogenase
LIGTHPHLETLAQAFQAWLDARRDAHAHLRVLPRDFGERVEVLCELQRELFDAGWALYGWPEAHGGYGGNVLHRAVVTDLLAANGYPPRHNFEHLDILTPALTRYAQPELLDRLFLPTLRGDVRWCQGFSEPGAGSDLAALRTSARAVEGGYRIDGHKIWTSWAVWADHCLLLARTGSTQDRHRGLTAFAIELSTPGVEVRAITQANGTDELAEVFFDGAIVPASHMLGNPGEGWSVAMHILAGERGSYTWLRQCELLAKLERLASTPGADDHAIEIGESLTRLLALRCRSRAVIETLARGEAPGPESSVTKVLVIDAEQHFYDVVRQVLSPGLDFGSSADVETWQEAYLYSRAASVYGGSRQIQLNVIAKLMIARGASARAASDGTEAELVRASVADALAADDDSLAALDGLDWWSIAARPQDALGRAAFGAFFEQQGRKPTTSPALAAVLAAPIADALSDEPANIAIAFDNPGPEGAELLVTGSHSKTTWVAMLADDGSTQVIAVGDLEFEKSLALDSDLLRGARQRSGAPRRLPGERAAHVRATALARIATAYEMLGAAGALLDRAVTHTHEREQFGRPISEFQAVQHLLSESQVDLSALAEFCDAALEQWCAGDGPELAAAAKAFAGRTCVAVAQRALQCFGAIGFTAEHAQHVYARRIHTLDALLGSERCLLRELGLGVVHSGAAPRGIQVWRPRTGDAT